jgi:two-component system, NtrC family, sensor histidine kinase PilS
MDEHSQPVVLRWFLPFRVATYVILLGVVAFWLHSPGYAQILFVVYSILTLGMALGVTFAGRIGYKSIVPIVITLQFLAEIAFESAVVATTGNINSPFLGLFLLTIVSAALVYQLVGTLVMASTASMAYVFVVWMGMRESVNGADLPTLQTIVSTQGTVFYSLLLHILIFYLVAFISGALAYRLRSQDQKLADASMALKRARLETDDILRHLNSGLLTIDHAGSIIYFNRTAERILGYTEEQVRGLLCAQVFAERMPQFAQSLMDGVQRGVEHPRREIDITDAKGRVIPIGLSTSILRDEDQTSRGVIGIFSDLTSAKELENKVRAADRLAAVGELSASIAHEIRNPLAAISGSVEVLRSDLPVTGENARLMELIVKESHRLSRILTDFLTYARLGRTAYTKVELCHVISDVLQIVRHHQSFSPNIDITLEARETCAYVSGDDDLIKQLLVNLVTNACESFGGRAGRVVLRIFRLHTGAVLLEISDDGPGIPPQHLPRIFEPFYSTKKQGTGLGLAIVHRICSLLKLTIQVDSAAGGGTTFRIEFPPSVGLETLKGETSEVGVYSSR